ncbi:hypothetical protein BJF78_27080 [Pseudonocardia sp. CNS-139]|nr:hypothetical protein BJF78_27080 [Pseudonocardia sp. CNS-139]
MHRKAGGPDDVSLFGWVVRHYPHGWLTCDDGSGEVADFVHLAPDGMLRLIHVKSARKNSRTREVAASMYEVVVGQAVKNLALLDDLDRLAARLDRPGAARFATWHDGTRQPDRAGFLAALRARTRELETEVVIVQPHVRKPAYDAVRTGGVRDDLLRLYLLESLLNGASSSVVARGATLKVLGDQG